MAGPDNLIICRKRKEGYLSALEDYEITFDESYIVECRFGEELEAEKTINDLLKSGKTIDGVFASNDMAGLGAISAIKKANIKIPEEIAVVGFSNWQFSSLVNPSLSSISQPGYEMGREAAKLILEEINAKEPGKRQVKILDTELIVRDSSNRQ